MTGGQAAATGTINVRRSNVGSRRGSLRYEAYRFSNGRNTHNPEAIVIETRTIDYPVKFTNWVTGDILPKPEWPHYTLYTINPVNWALIKTVQRINEEDLPNFQIDMNDLIANARRAHSRFTRVVIVWDDGTLDTILDRHVEDSIFFLESY